MDNFDLRKYLAEGKLLKEDNEYSPNWINSDSPKAKILTDVYYIGNEAEGEFSGLRGSAVPSYELANYSIQDIENEGDGMLYIEKGETGYYDEDEGMFESEDASSTRINSEYIELLKDEMQDEIQNDILDFWETQQDDASQSDGEYEAEWDVEFFTQYFPQYKGREDEIKIITDKYIG